MRTRWRTCRCMNNNMQYNNNDLIENMCPNAVSPANEYNSNCSCGFDDEIENNVFPENPNLGQSYVPIQTMDKTLKPCPGLKHGTIFPELVSPYMPGDSMKQIKYLEKTNHIGEGCNKCQ